MEGEYFVAEDEKPSVSSRRKTRASMKRKSLEIVNSEESKRLKTYDDFFNFCNFVLAYEEQLASNHLHDNADSAGESSHSTTPTGSGSGCESCGEERAESLTPPPMSLATPPMSPALSPVSLDGHVDDTLEYTSDDESWNLVTCFCRRPFAGRPMIECSRCQTWVHLYCAKIKKDQVPEIYCCPKCTSARSKAKRKTHASPSTANSSPTDSQPKPVPPADDNDAPTTTTVNHHLT